MSNTDRWNHNDGRNFDEQLNNSQRTYWKDKPYYRNKDQNSFNDKQGNENRIYNNKPKLNQKFRNNPPYENFEQDEFRHFQKHRPDFNQGNRNYYQKNQQFDVDEEDVHDLFDQALPTGGKIQRPKKQDQGEIKNDFRNIIDNIKANRPKRVDMNDQSNNSDRELENYTKRQSNQQHSYYPPAYPINGLNLPRGVMIPNQNIIRAPIGMVPKMQDQNFNPYFMVGNPMKMNNNYGNERRPSRPENFQQGNKVYNNKRAVQFMNNQFRPRNVKSDKNLITVPVKTNFESNVLNDNVKLPDNKWRNNKYSELQNNLLQINQPDMMNSESTHCDVGSNEDYNSLHSEDDRNVLQVVIKLLDREDVIRINKNEDTLKVTRDFCQKNKLNERLIKPIHDKIKQALKSLDLLLDHTMSTEEELSLTEVKNYYKEIEDEQDTFQDMSCFTDLGRDDSHLTTDENIQLNISK
jgi:hypothetical protein